MTSDKAKRRHLKKVAKKNKEYRAKREGDDGWWCDYECPHLYRRTDGSGKKYCQMGMTRRSCKKARDRREASKRKYDPFKEAPHAQAH